MDMAYCVKCGQPIDPAVVYCGNCGVRVDAARPLDFVPLPVTTDIAPPRMHWLLVALLTVLTLGIFGFAWMFVQWRFVNKIDPGNKSSFWFWAGILLTVMAAFVAGPQGVSGISILFAIAMLKMRPAIESYGRERGIPTRISKPLTFFLGTFYLQYHLTRIANSMFAATEVRQVLTK